MKNIAEEFADSKFRKKNRNKPSYSNSSHQNVINDITHYRISQISQKIINKPQKHLQTNFKDINMMKEEKEKLVEKLNTKIFLEKQKIIMQFQRVIQEMNEAMYLIEKHLIDKLQMQQQILRQILTKQNKRIQSCGGFSPFDFNSSLNLSLSMIQTSQEQDCQSNFSREIKEKQNIKAYSYQMVREYLDSSTNLKSLLFLYNQQEVEAIIKNILITIKIYSQQIKKKQIVGLKTTDKIIHKNVKTQLKPQQYQRNERRNKIKSQTKINIKSQISMDSPIKMFENTSKNNNFQNLYERLRTEKSNEYGLSIQRKQSLFKANQTKKLQPKKNNSSSRISIDQKINKQHKNQPDKKINPDKNQSKKLPTFDIPLEPYFIFHNDGVDEDIKKSSHTQNVKTVQQIISEKENPKNQDLILEPVKVDPFQQALTLEWCEDVVVENITNLLPDKKDANVNKCMPTDSILCLLYIVKNHDVQKDGKKVQASEKYLALGCKDKNIYIYLLGYPNEYQNVFKLQGHYDSVCTLTLFEQKNVGLQFLLSGGDTNCATIIMWDTSAWTIYSRFCFHQAAITTILPLSNVYYSETQNITQSQTQQFIISGSYDRKLMIFNSATNQIHYNQTLGGPISHGCFINNFNSVAIAVASVGILIIEINARSVNNDYGQQKRSIKSSLEIIIKGKVLFPNNVLPTSLTAFPGSNKIVVGLKNGDLFLADAFQPFNIEKYEVMTNSKTKNSQAIMSVLVINRIHNEKQPLLIVSSFKNKRLQLINWETKIQKEIKDRYEVEIRYGCGINPLMVINSDKQLAIVNQNSIQRQVTILKLKFL